MAFAPFIPVVIIRSLPISALSVNIRRNIGTHVVTVPLGLFTAKITVPEGFHNRTMELRFVIIIFFMLPVRMFVGFDQ